MIECCEKILENYQVRKTKKQKTEFIEFLKEELKKMEIELKVETGGILKSRNLVVGDLSKSKMIVGAHYDTAPEFPVPNFVVPDRKWLCYAYQFVLGIGIAIIVSFISFISSSLVGGFLLILEVDEVFQVLILSIVGGIILLFLLMFYFGKANPHTVNDNTSGVLTLLEIMASLDQDIRDSITFVFFDHEEIGLFGSRAFNTAHAKEIQNQLLLNFDCVSEGDTIFMVYRHVEEEVLNQLKESFKMEENKELMILSEKKVFYPSDQKSFKYSIGVAALKYHKRIGHYMNRIHTRRDVICDRRNIEILKNGVVSYLKAIVS